MEIVPHDSLSFKHGEYVEFRFKNFVWDGPIPCLLGTFTTEGGTIEVWIEDRGIRIQLQPLDKPK